jgi:hypothetical protein
MKLDLWHRCNERSELVKGEEFLLFQRTLANWELIKTWTINIDERRATDLPYEKEKLEVSSC